MTELETACDLMRRGHAHFERAVSALSDAEMGQPSLLPGWSRAHVLAHVGLNAVALGRLVTWAKTGRETPMYADPGARAHDIEVAALLPAADLRRRSAQEEARLEESLASLSEVNWLATVRTAQGRDLPAGAIPWLRARELWIHAVDLDGGAHFDDFPADLIDRLITDALIRRRASGERLRPTPIDRPRAGNRIGPGEIEIEGSASDIARWLTGRGRTGVRTPGGAPIPDLAPWL